MVKVPSEEWYEMDWLLTNLRASPSIYLIEEVIEGARKEYSSSDVHRWGRTVECGGVYGKLRDLVRLRVFEAVAREELDKGLIASLLRPYEDEVQVDEGKNLVTVEEIEVRLKGLMGELRDGSE